jgi:NitT/TauT family transport system permease protein
MCAVGSNGKSQGPSSADYFDSQLIVARQKRERRDRILVALISLAFLASFLGVWQLVHVTGLIKPVFVSNPVSVLKALVTLLQEAKTWTGMQATFVAAISGLAIGSILGITAGVLLARTPVLRRAMHPYLTIFNAFPRPAFAPIFILWFGLGALPKITVAVTIVFFVLLFNTMAGMKSVNTDIAFLGRSLGMSRWQQFRMIELPHSLPTIVAGLRLAAVYSVLGVVVSEIVAANEGLGQQLVQYTNQFAIAESFAVLGLMAALAVILDLCVSVVQRRLTWGADRSTDNQ